MNEQTYNGWTNYETWNVNLWITNDYDINLEKQLRGIEKWFAYGVLKYVKKKYPNGTPDMDSEKDYEKVNWNEITDAWNE